MISVTAACSATFNNHGYIPPEEELAAILPGVDTRESVESSVGRPATSGVMRDEAWFYADYRVRNFAYRAPEIIERNIVAISFDDAGVVQNIERFGLEDGQIVPLSRRVTESSVQEITLLRQILQNFGRINVADALGGDT
ncbi:outer membrane protein assembly factor BamE [Rhodophyticola porphyridii]|uniref:outer membrane protein assembly factor BamE n=1 Tax=Rhodophyticola porphyridii TaxID=1852017 RepID=UPI001F1A93D9|nr:outer membrane protein assembly factor BamE [Rhodophyticola porphyridii]